MSEFYDQAQSWNKQWRFVVNGMLETDSLFPMQDYSYFCYDTRVQCICIVYMAIAVRARTGKKY